MELVEIQQLIREGKYEVTFHAQQERLEENLDLVQIEQAIIAQGEILEEYPDDPRGESCLILAFVGSTPIHVVVGWAPMKTETERMLRFITVYKPTLPKWVNPRTRGGRL
jgi:hypothetical protein